MGENCALNEPKPVRYLMRQKAGLCVLRGKKPAQPLNYPIIELFNMGLHFLNVFTVAYVCTCDIKLNLKALLFENFYITVKDKRR